MAPNQKITTSKKKGRSRVTNGIALFPEEVDGRGFYSRRLRDLIALHSTDLGGADRLSEAECAIIRRASVITIALEALEMKFAQATEPAAIADLDLYQRMSNTLNRLLKTIGIKRRSKNVTPQSPREYLRSRIIDHDTDEPRVNGHHRVRASHG